MITFTGFETVATSQNLNPSDLFVCDGRLCIAINRSSDGYLVKDTSSGEPFLVDKNKQIMIVSNIEMQKTICQENQ